MKNERYWSGTLTLENFEFVAGLFRARLVGNRWSFAASNNHYTQPNLELRTSCHLHNYESNPLKIELEADAGHISVHEMTNRGTWSWGLHVYPDRDWNPHLVIEPDSIEIAQKNSYGDDILWLIVLEEKPE